MASELPRTATPASMAELAALLGRVLPSITTQTRAHLLAQIAIENDNGKAVIQNNVGNLSANPRTTAADYWRPEWFAEPAADASPNIRGLHQLMLEKKVPEAFSAWPTLEDGMRQYVALLQRERFAELLRAQDPEAFLQAIRTTGYTPDLKVDATRPGFFSLVKRWGGEVPSGVGVGAVIVLLGAAAWAAVRAMNRL